MGVSNAPISRSTCSDDKRNRDNNRDGLIIITDLPDARRSLPTNSIRLSRVSYCRFVYLFFLRRDKVLFSPSSCSNESKEISAPEAESDPSSPYFPPVRMYICTYTEGKRRRWKFLGGSSRRGRSLNLDCVAD